MTSLAELRDELTALGLSTSTGSLRGEERRAALESRLRDARIKLGLAAEEQREDKGRVHGDGEMSTGKDDTYRSLTLSELRSELEARKLSTQTPGLKGEARRHALIQRLQNAGAEPRAKSKAQEVPEQGQLSDTEALKSSRSSTSSYSAASEFLFFDSSRSDSESSEQQQASVPSLRLPAPSRSVETSSFSATIPQLSTDIRSQLERELVDLRKALHDSRSQRSRATSRRLYEAGFDADLDTLSSAMAQLETERQRLLRVAFAHELVKTSALSGQQVELVQEDAVGLIEKRQEMLRHQIYCVKHALAISRDDEQPETESHITKLERAIRRVETQLKQFTSNATARSSVLSVSLGSSDSGPETQSTPVLMRCRSVPAHKFHETWQELDDDQKQQLHHELQAHKSFLIRRDRVCVGNAPNSARTIESPGAAVGRQGILAFTRYPPTYADKLGIKALFLEQSQRSVNEIRRVYELALATEPNHALVLGNYARFLHERCKEHARAEQLYARAIEADPQSAANLASYATFLHRTRHAYDQAESLYAKALQLAPQDPVLLGNYASLLRKRADGSVSQLLEAKQFLLRALDVNKDYAMNRLRLLAVMEDLGETSSVLLGYEQLVRDVQSTGEAIDNNDVGHKVTARMAREISRCVHVYGNFANFLTRSRSLDRAKQIYETALRLRPDDALLQRNYSFLLREYKRTPRP